jgi:hypothetical protein
LIHARMHFIPDLISLGILIAMAVHPRGLSVSQ